MATLLSFGTGCDNTLDVTADWKEIPVIYGLLNPSASANFIRINRAYLNETGDAVQFAQEPDSIYFKDLTVQLIEYRNNQELNTINLELVNGDSLSLAKDTGVFANSPNYLYRTNYDIKSTDFSQLYRYELVVINNESGNVYRANANMVGNAELLAPFRVTKPHFSIEDDTNRFFYMIYREGPQAKMYDCVIRFRYLEYDTTDPSITWMDSVDWTIFSNRETIRLTGYQEQQTAIKSYLFYQFLASAIEEKPNIERKPFDMGLYLYGGGEDLYTYIEVNKPSIGIVQKKPEYTNIENGLGIFSSLNILAYPHATIDDPMITQLVSSPRIDHLNFVRP